MTTWRTIALGLTRPRGILFFEIDFFALKKLKGFAQKNFKYFEILRTRHGYHLRAYPFRWKKFRALKRMFKSDFSMKYEKCILRISPKWEEKTGRITSPRPIRVCGNFDIFTFVKGIDRYKFPYWCKA